MTAAHDFLQNLALVLCVAAVTTVVFQRFRQPVILGYLLAGLIIGPHLPIPLVADEETVRTLSELGVILVMFSLGLEFRLRKLAEVGPAGALIGVIEISLMIWLGFATGRLFGWSPEASLFLGAIVAISSTTIIAKAFEEEGIKGKVRNLVFGVLVFEDLVAILLLALLTAVASGRGLNAHELALTTGRLVAFLVALLVLGMAIVPRLMRAVVRLGRSETILVASVGLCFAFALLAQAFGYSVALGAFVAGALVAESGEERRIAPLVRPVRDIFAAIFFVAAGMSIDPALIAQHWSVVLILVVVVILGKIVSVGIGTFLAGHGTRTALETGMSLAQIGEFSFIIAGLGLARGMIPDELYPAVIAVSAITALTTPWLIRGGARLSRALDLALPRPLQTFASLYGSWVEQLRAAQPRGTGQPRLRRLTKLLIVDALFVGALVVGATLTVRPISAALHARFGVALETAHTVVVVVALVLIAPFVFGIVQVARRLGLALAELALPTASAGVADLAAAPRRALVVTLQLACVLVVGTPLVAITQPFLGTHHGALVFLTLLAVVGFAFWKSARNLDGHVRAGAQMIVEALATQSRSITAEHSLEAVHRLLPGLGTPIPFRVDEGSVVCGKTLAEINLRGATGATVLAITRGDKGMIVPRAEERLSSGDILALAGTHEAIEAAVALLAARKPSESAPLDESA